MIKKGFPFLSVLLLLIIPLSSFRNAPFSDPIKKKLKTIVIDAGHGLPDIGARGEYSNEAALTLAIATQLGKKLEEALPDCKIIYTRTTAELPGGLTNKNDANRLRAKMANEAHGDLFIAIHINDTNERYRTEIIGYKEETYMATVGKGKKKKKVQKTHKVPITKRYRIPETVTGTETYVWATNKNDIKKKFTGSQDDNYGEKADSSYQYFDSPQSKILASLRTAKYFDNSCLLAGYVQDEFVKTGRRNLGVKQRDYEGIWVLQATAMPSILVECGFICTPSEETYMNSKEGQDEISDCVKNAVLKYKAFLEGK